MYKCVCMCAHMYIYTHTCTFAFTESPFNGCQPFIEYSLCAAMGLANTGVSVIFSHFTIEKREVQCRQCKNLVLGQKVSKRRGWNTLSQIRNFTL